MERLQTVTIRLTRIVADTRFQPRVGGLSAEHILSLQECPETWPPLSVVVVNDTIVLVDGFHRLAAAQNLGLTEVLVQVLPQPEDGDLYALAFSLNASHGRPLSLNDRRQYAEFLLHNHPEWSDREIGRRTGLSSNTVGKIRGHLETSAQIEQPRTRIGGGGYTYSVDTTTKTDLRTTAEHEPSDEHEWTADDRRDQREIVRYLRGLADLLLDGNNLPSWETPNDAAFACKAILGEVKATEMAEVLGEYSLPVIEVAMALGWDLDGGQQ